MNLDFCPTFGSCAPLTMVEARFLKLITELRLSTRQADAVSRLVWCLILIPICFNPYFQVSQRKHRCENSLQGVLAAWKNHSWYQSSKRRIQKHRTIPRSSITRNNTETRRGNSIKTGRIPFWYRLKIGYDAQHSSSSSHTPGQPFSRRRIHVSFATKVQCRWRASIWWA